jgi:alpha-L-fucosidase 2
MECSRRDFAAALGASAGMASAMAQEASRGDPGAGFPVDTAAYLSRHEVVYLSPPTEGWEGLPIGNGDLSAMIWTTENALRLQINKADIWDQADAEAPKLLRSCGRLTIDFATPCFEWLYLDDFEARLSPATGSARFASTTPFAAISVTALAQARRNVIVLDCTVEWRGELSAAGAAAQISVERWGSRGFNGWYHSIRRGASEGLGRATAGAKGRDAWIEERLGSGLTFAVACRVAGGAGDAAVVHKHRAGIGVSAEQTRRFTVLIAVATSEESAEPLKAARDLLESSERAGLEELRGEHRRWWGDFWRDSFVHIGDDYLENLYYLHMYLMACASRGRYPAVFNAATFTWNHDVRQWATPHHWNMQQPYWSLCAANHPALLVPYLDTYWRLAPQAEAHAAQRGYAGAILWSEPHNLDGGMAFWNRPDMLNDFTPASQMAQFFWQYFQYTGDREFLRSRGYPFMKKAAEFYLQYLKWDEAKQEFYVYPSQPYEYPENNRLRNPLTDLAMIRTSFKACIEASMILGSDAEKRERWRHVLDRLPAYRYTALESGGEGLVAVEDADGKEIDLGPGGYGMCRNVAPVFPADEVGLGQQGSRLFEAMKERARRHPRNVLAISPVAIVKARLGMAGECLADLRMSVRQLQHFPQGMFYNIDHWHYLSRYAAVAKDPMVACQRDYIFDRSTRYRDLKVRGTDERVDTPAAPFVQCGLETLGILAAAVNEMLLQSHEGVIRVFPATPGKWPAAFTLLARGAFLISSARNADSAPAFVLIKSLAGNRCRMANPWPGQPPVLRDRGSGVVIPLAGEGDVVAFETAANATYVLTATASANAPLEWTRFESKPNPAPKKLGEAVLGKARDF